MPFAGYPSPFLRAAPRSGSKVQQLLWGDFVELRSGRDGEWVEARARRENGWLRASEIQDEQLLEINFVDVGQGDGCFLVTPDDRFLLIDAGEQDNMDRFLRWRFNLRNHPERQIHFDAAILSHPDADHYKGLEPLLDSGQFTFRTIYHNGIVPRARDPELGARVRDGRRSYLTELVRDHAAMEALCSDPANVGRTWYPNLMRKALLGGRVRDIRMLCSDDEFLPRFDTGDLTFQVLSPVTEPDAAGLPRLRSFGDDGRTKNGHSIVLLLTYRDVRILLGGDLNAKAEDYLIEQWAGEDPSDLTGDALDAAIARAREVFGADIAKACHHGSADFTETFLRAVDAIATVVSSGDDESYAHPRPDALGAIGRYGRGRRPLLFSTELARSTKDVIQDPDSIRAHVSELLDLHRAAEDDDAKNVIAKKVLEALSVLDRSVAVYGTIVVRTDGRRVLMAQKLERPRGATREEFDVHLLEQGADGRLEYRIG